MTAQVERDFDFQAGVYFQNTFLMNVYSFTITIQVETDSIHEQNVAMERLKYLVYEVFENAVFVDQQEKDIIKKYKDAGIKVCTIPDEPYDQIISLLIMMKLDSVCETRLRVTDITLTSKLSDEVKFKENLATATSTYNTPGWWNNPNPDISGSETKASGKEKVVKLKNNEWKGTGLVWKDKREKSTEIIFSIDPEK